MIRIIKIYVDENSILNKAVIMIVDGHTPLYSDVVEIGSLQHTLHQMVKDFTSRGKEIKVHGAILDKNYYE